MNFNVAVVIVTYNRLEKLTNTLKCYDKQMFLPKHIIVVNNDSKDGTDVYLKKWKNEDSEYQKHVITLDDNLGGSGGFFVGEEYAMNLSDIDWVMIADDDAYPDNDYLYGMKLFVDNNRKKDIAIICGKVMEHNSSVNVHRTYLVGKWHWNFHEFIPQNKYEEKFFTQILFLM